MLQKKNLKQFIIGMKKKTNKEKKSKKEKEQRLLNRIIIIILTIVCTFSYCRQQKALEISGITTCRIIKKTRSGSPRSLGLRLCIEYFVSNKRYETEDFDNSYKVGDCFLIEYSVENPQICRVLWDRGKQNCDCME